MRSEPSPIALGGRRSRCIRSPWWSGAVAALLLATGPVLGQQDRARKGRPAPAVRATSQTDGQAEARLIEVYRLAAGADSRRALDKARSLAADYPTFQLAQLIYGDLLMAQARPPRVQGVSKAFGPADLPPDLAKGATRLRELREESRLRLLALKERPPAGAVPSQFLSLSRRNKHAIAVDVSKARLYLFEQTPRGLQLMADYYISVGKAGVGKNVEGDQRTPLGVYFVTSNLDPKSLQDLYGAGALPINYPNALDIRRGKGGSGIWLHGTPSAQFSRAPLATDGCVAIANPDLQRILRNVEIRTTPVVIAQQLNWVRDDALSAEKESARSLVESWRRAKAAGDLAGFNDFYSPDFTADDKTTAGHRLMHKRSASRAPPADIRLGDLSMLRWNDASDVMIATFGEVITGENGVTAGRVIRQYWERRGGRWKIVYEGVVG
ncbi:MAG: hypothetical protein EOO28_01655 [Comamonadaceae bacterium]|nr:MAG: hypothetical protein EOO28_01655 [Comamonadaceae bacterium]